eukprot:CAMPEP_0201482296 /NCGR_PEP_ID=MMETSP0151_2-20130828/6589_1 /ASSEMBLY_ACC=CAM_ASM_000257 /TAXON_ID=200890 /ORGANISM="Paramoeba atlantica, Strain 621/1 / CCAP 1560/9" /LENGTH=514 /DNA_ID=CAMNT_0047864937 /DNA_START=72 /DNA_END=1617 /DNA_ORIENTATION=-
MADKADIGLIGLAVMGENLALNMLNHGYRVAVFNRTTSKVTNFAEGRAKGKNLVPCLSPEEFCASLSLPRKIIVLVQAGKPVDLTIEKLLPNLSSGDIVIDGGNSHFADSQRRYEELSAKNINFVGSGVSGGEEGALLGPSLMPGGNPNAWPHLKELMQKISAKANDGSPCCDWIGKGGSGHFVKMVHNGIEYGDMQLIAEGYLLMKHVLGMTNAEIGKVFEEWNQGEMESFLVEITSQIMFKKDEETDKDMIDVILDTAGQKGTGKWTAINALDHGMPVTLIGEAVFARCLSAQKEERVEASKILSGPEVAKFEGSREQYLENLKDALYAAKLVSYAQGFVLLREASKEYKWDLQYGAISSMWRGGCIIRSRFLNNIKEAFDRNSELSNLLLDPFFGERVQKAQAGWRQVASSAMLNGIPIPAISTALSYFDGYRTADGSANMIQAQRDFFGAHTFERKDKERGQFFHCNWTGRGGNTTAGTLFIKEEREEEKKKKKRGERGQGERGRERGEG